MNYGKNINTLYMKTYENYINILRCIFKNFDNEFDDTIKYILNKIFDTYYLERDTQLYNIDNVFKKYNINMYNLLSKKYVMTNSKRLMFIKHRYNKKEYIMNLLKKTILKDNENLKKIVDEILKKDINYYSKYIKDNF